MSRPFTFLVWLGVRTLKAMCRSRADLVIENLALQQQIAALKKRRPRPLLDETDRAFWIALRSCWSGWASRLFIVQPDTVAKWNRARFRRHWAEISKRKTALAGLGSTPRFAISFTRWPKMAGGHHGSTAS